MGFKTQFYKVLFINKSMPDTVLTGSIGSTSPELSRYILDSDEILEDAMRHLEGFARQTNNDGSPAGYVRMSDRAYNKRCLTWMRSKLQQILNKNMYLSSLNSDEMYSEARFMICGFLNELYFNSKEFDLTVERYEELRHLYSNYLHQAIRRPLNESDKRFLKETTTESTQRLQQTISEQQVKKGIVGKLFG